MLKLTETVLNDSGSKSKIIHQPLLSYDPNQRQPNIKLAKSKQALEPNATLEDDLKEIITYLKIIIK
jgi:UDP-glucuronate decarboxylase